MNPYEFRDRWSAWYPESVPVAHLLRERHVERWLRIYSLPGGQRHPTVESDWDELAHRHQTAANVVLGLGASCALIVAKFATDLEDRQLESEFVLEPLWLIRDDFPEDDSEPEDHAIDLLWTLTTWEPARFDAAVRRRADDRSATFLLVALENGNVYAPYDGGADLFAPTAGERSRYRQALRAWTSPRRDGL